MYKSQESHEKGYKIAIRSCIAEEKTPPDTPVEI